jgi:hypothetical protein
MNGSILKLAVSFGVLGAICGCTTPEARQAQKDQAEVAQANARWTSGNIVAKQKADQERHLTFGAITVFKGDCLWSLSKTIYGRGANWPLILWLNPTIETLGCCDLLKPGQILRYQMTDLENAQETKSARAYASKYVGGRHRSR